MSALHRIRRELQELHRAGVRPRSWKIVASLRVMIDLRDEINPSFKILGNREVTVKLLLS